MIPAVRSNAPADTPAPWANASPEDAPEESGARRGASRRPSVLLIDDQLHPDDALVRLLSLDGFRVTCQRSGMRGLARALATAWDAILLDLHLPDTSGLTVLQELRRERPATPVIVITGWLLDGDQEAAASLGAADFRRKPLDASELARALRAAIDARSRLGDRHDARLLHGRAIRGDRSAVDQLAAELLPRLQHRLQRMFPRASTDLTADAVEDALLEYAARPERFDPGRRVPLERYLLNNSSRNLINALDSERRRRARETRYAELMPPPDESPVRFDELDAWRELRITLELPAVAADAREREALLLWLEGEQRTPVLAEALGLSHLTIHRQRAEVKRFKDRTLKRLLRLWRRRS